MIREEMDFPKTWEEYEEHYGFNDSEEVYTNGSRLIPSFRVKQWLDHLEQEPCPNAISRSDMLDAIGHGTTYTSEDLQRIIKALPPVNPLAKDYNTIYYTPQPKTGHWIEIAKYSDGKHKIECSECGSHIFDRGHANSFNVKNKYKYCPNCGSRMVDPQGSEEV